jgi:hypothetical protein
MSIAAEKPVTISATTQGVAATETETAKLHRCLNCSAPLSHTFVDLGTSPLCESYLSAEQLEGPEPFYPLKVLLCTECLLVQLPAYVSGEHIFSEYAYFSSFSDSYLSHAAKNVSAIVERFGLTLNSFVVEVASNDGYLLRNFVGRQIPCLGIEPAANVARAAENRGIPTLVKFFGEQTAKHVVKEFRTADVLIANNVAAHVPDLHDFIRGIKTLIAANGVAVIEIQYLLRLIERNQFDTIYHEHFCYYTLTSLSRVLASEGLTVFDAEEIATHGGSLRVYAKHAENAARAIEPRVEAMLANERDAGLTTVDGHDGFAESVTEVKRALLEFLIAAKRAGKTVAGYGAPGKGNTLLNYCGIRQDFIDFTVDRNPYKHGKFLPGTRIPIFAPEKIAEAKPDYVLILPWNIREEIANQLAYIRDWGAKFVVPIPKLEIW